MSELTREDKFDIAYALMCQHCVYHRCNAEMEGNTSICKRIDHKTVKVATPFFKSYDCGQFCKYICADFKPKKLFRYCYDNWTSYEDIFQDLPATGTVPLILNDDNKVRFHVLKSDWIHNRHFTSEGKLNWYFKEYYAKRKVVREYNEEYVPCDSGR